MATTVEGARLSELHRLAQARLGAQTVAQTVAAWRLIDPNDLDGTSTAWLSLMVPLVQVGRRTSARLAANYLSAFRSAELGVDAGLFTPVLAEDIAADQVKTSLLVTGPISVKRAMARAVPLERAVSTAQVSAARAAMRHVTDGGRATVRETTKIDGRGRGWVRVLSGNACPFCQSLADDGDAFTSHDGCSCSAEPAYS